MATTKTAILLSYESDQSGMELFLSRVGFSTANPKIPTLQKVIDAAPDLIVIDWHPGHKQKNSALVNDIRQCSATAGIPILISASEKVSDAITSMPMIVVCQIPAPPETMLNLLKLLGFPNLEFFAEERRELASPGEQRSRSPSSAGEPTSLIGREAIEWLCTRLPVVVHQLRHRTRQRAALEMTDEYDIQYLLHALLRLFFDDIRPEEVTPTYAGGGARMDFLLKKERTVIEAKMTRQGLEAREVGSQLIEDIARYREHRDCKTLFCLVYDPEHRIQNPRGIQDDLSGTRDGLEVRVAIVPKGA